MRLRAEKSTPYFDSKSLPRELLGETDAEISIVLKKDGSVHYRASTDDYGKLAWMLKCAEQKICVYAEPNSQPLPEPPPHSIGG